MSHNILYALRSGKPNKPLNHIANFANLLVPDCHYRKQLQSLLSNIEYRYDYQEIMRRTNYYIKVSEPFKVSDNDELRRDRRWLYYTGRIDAFRRDMFHTSYYFDQHDVTRYFAGNLRWNFCPGDVYYTPSTPTVVKSRLLEGDNSNSVLLKLDKLRHFIFVNDHKTFREKQNRVIFRGKIRDSRLRKTFLERFFDNPRCDCGVVGRDMDEFPEEWCRPKKTIAEHLDYKFIMAIKGNDVASNLKWVMSSNSLAVMPRPTCETWFMEGTLKPDYHYVLVRDNYSDLEEKIQYYIDHPEAAEAIIEHAHEYMDHFRDREREKLIGLCVLDKYFRLSGQK